MIKPFPFTRRAVGVFSVGVLAASMLCAPLQAQAQSRKDAVILGMILEPTSLDPTMAPAAAIGEVVHYNILEGLTKINVDGSISPLLAESWKMDADGKAYTFKLRKGVKFQDGALFDSASVKFSFERAKDAKSTNKAKGAVFNNISHIATPDAHTVVLVLTNPDGNFLFRMGENTAVILHPDSAANAATKPVGTGPYKLDSWAKGTAVTLTKWDGFRDAKAIPLKKVTFRFINDSAAQVAALLAGDIDGMPRFQSPQSLQQFQKDKRFVVELGSTAGKGIMTINNRKKPFDDVRVRRALSHAIDKKAFIDGVFEGLAKPIGSHMAPTDAGYVELSGLYAYDPEKAKACSRRLACKRHSMSP
jgi:peptide/nickel transport system substrate-binding protein